MCWKGLSQISIEEFDKMKNILNSHFTLTILVKLYEGFRPSQIAKQLGVTPQDIYYHTERMIDADLITKDTSNGTKWIIKEKGRCILKQKLTGSVNYFTNYQTKSVARVIPTRLDNISFAFNISSPISEDPHFDWIAIENGVSKYSIKYDTHTVELIRSKKKLYYAYTPT